jgi:hypothetical protein
MGQEEERKKKGGKSCDDVHQDPCIRNKELRTIREIAKRILPTREEILPFELTVSTK